MNLRRGAPIGRGLALLLFLFGIVAARADETEHPALLEIKDAAIPLKTGYIESPDCSAGPGKNICVFLMTPGLPVGAVVDISNVRSKLFTPQGDPVEIGPPQPIARPYPDYPAVEAALGGMPLVNGEIGILHHPFSAFTIASPVFLKYVDQSLKWQAAFDLQISQYQMTAEIPARAGGQFSHDDDERCEIKSVTLPGKGVRIILRKIPGSQQKAEPVPEMNDLQKNRERIDARRWDEIYVLCNRERNEAILLQQKFTLANDAPSALNELLSKECDLDLTYDPLRDSNAVYPLLTNDWLAKAELVRLDLVPIKMLPTEFADAAFCMDGKNSPMKTPSVWGGPDLANLAKIVLPKNPTREQVDDYIRSIMLVSQRQCYAVAENPQSQKLAEVGPENLDALIAAQKTWQFNIIYVTAAIELLAQPANKEKIIKSLAANPQLVYIVAEKGWSQDARDILIAGLQANNAKYKGKQQLKWEECLPFAWIKAVVALHDPSTYADLKTYYLQAEYKTAMADLFRELPNFDLAGTVDQAWKIAQSGPAYNLLDILPAAASFGHVDALDYGAYVLRTDNDDRARQRVRDVFTAYTAASGDDQAILAWYDANWDRLIFDPQAKKFVVNPSPSPRARRNYQPPEAEKYQSPPPVTSDPLGAGGLVICAVAYFIGTGIVYGIIFVCGLFVAVILPPWSFKAYFGRIERIGLFLVLLLCVGTIFSIIWNIQIYNHLYYDNDYMGFGFLPFVPISRNDPYLIALGTVDTLISNETLAQLQHYWRSFAAATWGITLVLYFWVKRMKFMQIGWGLGE